MHVICWSVIPGAYDYELCYRPGKLMENADALSCLPLPAPVTITPPPLPHEVLLLEIVPNTPMHAARIAAPTPRDPVLSRVPHWVLHGWQANVTNSCFKPFLVLLHDHTTHHTTAPLGVDNKEMVPAAC